MADSLSDTIATLGAIPLKRYCQITGEKPNAIYQRKFKGIWVEGVHLTKPTGADWWVNLAAVRKWILAGGGSEREADVAGNLERHVRAETSKASAL